MSDTSHPALRRIRTFAADLEAAQNPGGKVTTPSPAETPSEGQPIETAKVAPVATFKATAPSEHIPAFHELKKESATHTASVQSPTTASVPKITVRAKKRDLKKSIDAGGGMIITDTKRNKQSFISAFIASIESWWKSRTAANKKKVRTYTITDTERRKGVIQKATSKAGTIFTADNETLKEEIRRRTLERPHTTPETDPRLTWTPNTEAGYALLDGAVPVAVAEPHRVTVEFKQASVPTPVIVEPAPVPPPVIEESVWEAPPVMPAAPVTVPPPPPVSEPVATAVPPPAFVPPPEPRTIVSPAFSEPAALTRGEAIKDRMRILIGTFRVNTNFITIGIAGILIFAAILTLTTRAIVKVLSTPDEPVVPTITEAPILPYTSTMALPLDNFSQSALLTALAEKTEFTGTVKEYQLRNKDTEPLSTADTLALLGFTDNQNLNQTITAIHVITLNGQRGLVFKVTDATTAFGALLSWEPRMLTYLGPVLGVETDDTPFPFTDQTVNGIDVRVLTISGTQRITYGFIAKDVVLITEDIGAFHTILGRQ